MDIKPYANLRHADLRGVSLKNANLRVANMRGTDLRGVNLNNANLRHTDLCGANMRDANLRHATLYGAYLCHTDLRDTDLRDAYLTNANLRHANLLHANLYGADLRDADLTGAELPYFQIPQEGDLVVYKKISTGICKLLIPSTAKRTATLIGRKCRAEYALVLEGSGTSIRDSSFEYNKDHTVKANKYNPDIRVECAGGIHFFLTYEEAQNF